MNALAKSCLSLGKHFLRYFRGGIDKTEGRQLLSDALVIGAALSPYAPVSVAPILGGVLGWAGSAVVSAPVSAEEALADMLEAVEAAMGTEAAPVPAPEPGAGRVRPVVVEVAPLEPVAEPTPAIPVEVPPDNAAPVPA